VRDIEKTAIVPVARRLHDCGFKIIATEGTAKVLTAAGMSVTRINKVYEGQPHIVDAIINGAVQLVVNTTEANQAVLQDSFSLRRTALMNKIPYQTTVAGARAVADAIHALQTSALAPEPLQDYLKG